MTTTSTPGPAGAVARTSTAPDPDGIARLQPYDGLFLRAEHLNQLQSYTQELTRALGQAGGTGVVHGYRLSLSISDATLGVGPGLAFAPNGQPLRMTTGTSVKVDKLTADNGAWVVELAAKDEPFGDETVFGALCEDPCEGAGASTRPYVAERVEVKVRRFVPAEASGGTPGERRSRVAKAWFAAEREEAGALVVAASARNPGRAGNFTVSAWTEATGLPASEVPRGFAEAGTVPIGVLLRVEDDLVLDTWIARRDRIDTPPRRSWEGRLGLRPWDVFVAQVLQFQVQLAEEWPKAAATFSSIAARLQAIQKLDDALKTLREGRRAGVTTQVSSASELLKGKVKTATGQGTLLELGFVELPPAGFLPVPAGDELVENLVGALFGDAVELRFCACRPDAVAAAVAGAQHLDRIPLTGEAPKRQVDILVPTDTGSWAGPGYGWVAFHSGRDRDCRVEEPEDPPEDPKDLVDVYVHTTTDADALRERLLKGERPASLPSPRVVPYPAGSWALPPADLQAAVDSETVGRLVQVVGLTASEQRARLAWVRAVLMGSKFLAGVDPPNVPAFAAVTKLPGHEEIHVLAQPVAQ
ncbi:MAG TPA: hypothetical protein VJ966_06620 [Actinomycetes bacterium]|nr:hypothetical protein [Actinomycetes bacterium]